MGLLLTPKTNCFYKSLYCSIIIHRFLYKFWEFNEPVNNSDLCKLLWARFLYKLSHSSLKKSRYFTVHARVHPRVNSCSAQEGDKNKAGHRCDQCHVSYSSTGCLRAGPRWRFLSRRSRDIFAIKKKAALVIDDTHWPTNLRFCARGKTNRIRERFISICLIAAL